MSELLTAAQMRAIEQAAIESGEVTGLELMERAGQGVVEAIIEEWPELGGSEAQAGGQPPDPRDISGMRKRAVVLCGPGNNGGDGFVVARLLQRQGWGVEVFLYGEAEKLPLDARVNYERWCALGAVAPLTESGIRSGDFATLYVDAIFGTGLSRALDGELFQVVRHLSGIDGDSYQDRLVSIDAPSGLCLDSGRVLAQDQVRQWPEGVFDNLPAEIKKTVSQGCGPRVLTERFAALTVCFDSAKPGHFLAQGPALCGKTVVKDIGLSARRRVYNGAKYDVTFPHGPKMPGGSPAKTRRPAFLSLLVGEAGGEDFQSKRGVSLSRLRKCPSQHKFGHGHALILSGGSGKTGAARLAARGALRIGAGLVTLGVPPNAQQEVACQITALMLQRVADAKTLENVLGDECHNALCLGPGMGLERARELVPVALATKRAAVLDADALSAFAEDPSELFDLLHESVVLTPHGGEFARLFPDIAAKPAEPPTRGPAFSKVDATREAAARAGCVVLFKGPDTVIASPNGQCAVNAAVYQRAAPWLATAGSGDVLAGFITGLLARGLAPQQAAETAAWLHVECARAFGPGLIAEDLPEMLPQVLSSLSNEQP
ncbi:NAD(P)H-hydrate dehydratase [uncultured Shimia sp.]|uniref:NAD(P)H-hydrate dehydratase n=1 Tax=uncultured Shimia sp. TaxID=573152 RepID=UPI00263262DD|nr:NAD(P)H-hydrate dehydratase [uncultured Shimia sp.]